MTAQLQSLLDKKVEGLPVVGVTSCPEVMDLALRRPGRLEVEVNVKMLAVLLDRLGLQMDEAMVTQLSSSTPGYVASDLALLMTRLARHNELSMDKVKEELVNARPAAIKTGLGSISHDKVG